MIEPVVPVSLVRPSAHLPRYAHPGDAGADLVSCADVELAPGERVLVPTGIAVAIPEGYVGLVHPRSGLAYKHGLSVVNAPGTIDSGYRGEIFVNLINLDPRDGVRIRVGDRVAQLIVQPVSHATFVAADQLTGTERGERGHGSTGR